MRFAVAASNAARAIWPTPRASSCSAKSSSRPLARAASNDKRSGNIFSLIAKPQAIVDCRHQIVIFVNTKHPQIAHGLREPSKTPIGFLNRHDAMHRVGVRVAEVDTTLNAGEAKFRENVRDFGVAGAAPVWPAIFLGACRIEIESDGIHS